MQVDATRGNCAALCTVPYPTRQRFLPARRSSSAVLAVALCLFVSLSVSVTNRSYIETDKRLELVLAWELPPAYLTVL